MRASAAQEVARRMNVPDPAPEQLGRVTVTADIVRAVRAHRAKRWSPDAIAEKFGISRNTVWKICSRRAPYDVV